ncbi:MAG TPA: HAD family hydrolase [Gemmatimonadaceae bacterium]|nr:HAD family hydrolase [Gemmatimonadaceae bacterium]
MRGLAVFDIDGTLTDTNAVDDECYLQAVGEALGIGVPSLDWSDAPHVTDSALLRWLAERHACELDASLESAIMQRFVKLLQQQLRESPNRFGAVRGAAGIRAALENRGWHVALATGGWAMSAELKLGAIGFDMTDVAIATGSDAVTRGAIVRLAHEKAMAKYGTFGRVVSVGDGVWDARTAAEVGWPFVGIASGAQADRLRDCGAATILPDLEDVSAVCAALDAATIPRPRPATDGTHTALA